MSLLLEALKKAELAKQAAKEQPAAADSPPPFTRDKLPDISQPMEIHSEDLAPAAPPPAPKRADKPVLELALEEPAGAVAAEPPPRPAPAEASYTPPEETPYSPPAEAAERKQAQQLFEAKEMDVNPRKPFYFTVAGLGVFALGTVGYFWYEMQPKNNYKIPPPSPQSAAAPVAAAPGAPAAPAAEPVAPAATTVTPPVGTQPAVPAKADSAPRTAPAPAPASGAVAAAPRNLIDVRPGVPAAPAATAAATAPPQRRPAPREGDITITPARVQTDPILESAFQAFNAGDLTKARDDYQQVLRYSPDNHDALLGLAAVETQAKRYDAADRYYTRLLELDPRDAYAQAGLMGLRGQVDPMASESRLKSMIALQPGVSVLHFALGNQYAAQGRWAEAQQAYFQAYSSDPEHPDYAYNLAVSLDRMHQIKPALEYYRRALALAGDRPVSFDKAQISKRVAQLEPGS